ncbi:hypothetical protein FB551_4117 [Chryseobacterium aquifrigidense]|uniref:Uncharacterized protein n=1 Tax=Chryseobacterium aquifrigidense TaxID=558021 RepID=A0A543E9Z1_9FLAO|nr:hypothetical protein FB551_4117 [Chryseobacterium aquifrigidense]
MCNCSKPITKTECQILRKYVNDPEGRTFIYHVFDGERGLEIAQVPQGINPNQIAIAREFIGSDGLPEWYYVKEHPCLYEKT